MTTDMHIQQPDNIRNMIHDIRSPLSSLKMIISFSNKSILEERTQLLYSINRIERILDSFSFNHPHEIEVDTDITELVNVVEKAIVEKLTEHSNIDPEINFTKPQNINELNIIFSSTDLERLLSNLLNNSIESKINAVTININLEINGGHALLSIEDNGKGIPQNILEQINAATSITYGKANGSGIGLVQVREAMDKHGGNMIISSKENIGTKVALSFKLND